MTLRELAARIAAFLTRRQGRSDLDDQLQFHRDMLEEQLRRQGLTAADAFDWLWHWLGLAAVTSYSYSSRIRRSSWSWRGG